MKHGCSVIDAGFPELSLVWLKPLASTAEFRTLGTKALAFGWWVQEPWGMITFFVIVILIAV